MLSYEILSHDILTNTVVQVMLRPQAEAMQHQAGQYLLLHLPGEEPQPFSIANAPSPDAILELHIRHLPAEVYSNRLIDYIKNHSALTTSGPFGSNVLHADIDAPMIFLAGGTGFAPCKAMLEYMQQQQIQRQVHLFWGARDHQDLYWHDHIKRWQQTMPDFQYTSILSKPTRSDHWNGEIGHAHEAVIATYPDLSAFQVYAAGPYGMVVSARELFLEHGVDKSRFFSDF